MKLNWDKYGIDVSKVVGGKTFCPKCHASRKHKRDKSLSVNLQSGLFNCHNCEFRGCVIEYERLKEYVKPLPRLEKLSKKLIDFFENERKISNNTLLRFGITESKEWMPQFEKEAPVICFNYFQNEKLINIKFRGPKKSFKMSKDAELIFYNLDAIKDENTCVIVEGEIDCLTLHECGIYNVVSVPNGASRGSLKMEYLDNCWQSFENKTKIILCVDADEPGIVLRNELARRLGKNKCWQVKYPEGIKDANEVLIEHGKEKVVDLINSAILWPVEGIRTIDDMFPTLSDWYVNGYPKGAKAGVAGFDKLLSFTGGHLTTVTGIPGHGKDEFVNLLMAKLAVNEGWMWGVLGFEETPDETASKIMEKVVGKSFAPRANPCDRITAEEFVTGSNFIQKYFFFINPEEIEIDLDSILEKAEELVKRFGIKGFLLNPWNWIDHTHQAFMSETEYVSITLTKIIRFARKYSLHVLLLAHTTKMKKNVKDQYIVPTLYDISGSAHFFNKTHNGICVYRDYKNNVVDVYVQKVKQSWLGKIGFSSYQFNLNTRQYSFLDSSVKEDNTQTLLPLPPGNWKPLSNYFEVEKEETE